MAELTAPVMIDGKPYGYSCASKIKGGKRIKVKLIPVELLDITDKWESGFTVLFIRPNGKKGKASMYISNNGNISSANGLVMINDSLFVEDSKRLQQSNREWLFK